MDTAALMADELRRTVERQHAELTRWRDLGRDLLDDAEKAYKTCEPDTVGIARCIRNDVPRLLRGEVR